MKTFDLTFGKVTLLQENIAEIIVDEDIELNLAMVEEFHHFLISELKSPFSVLVNKLNPYTYDFEAQLKLGAIAQLHAIAIAAYNDNSKAISEGVATIPRDVSWYYQIFATREQALKWLILEHQYR